MEFCQPVSRSTRVDLTVNGKSVGKVNELAALLGYEVKKLNRFTQKPCKELTDLTLIYRHTKTNPEQREALKTWARSETHSDLRRLAGEFLEEHGKSFWPTPEDPASPTDTLRYPRDSLLIRDIMIMLFWRQNHNSLSNRHRDNASKNKGDRLSPDPSYHSDSDEAPSRPKSRTSHQTPSRRHLRELVEAQEARDLQGDFTIDGPDLDETPRKKRKSAPTMDRPSLPPDIVGATTKRTPNKPKADPGMVSWSQVDTEETGIGEMTPVPSHGRSEASRPSITPLRPMSPSIFVSPEPRSSAPEVAMTDSSEDQDLEDYDDLVRSFQQGTRPQVKPRPQTSIQATLTQYNIPLPTRPASTPEVTPAPSVGRMFSPQEVPSVGRMFSPSDTPFGSPPPSQSTPRAPVAPMTFSRVQEHKPRVQQSPRTQDYPLPPLPPFPPTPAKSPENLKRSIPLVFTIVKAKRPKRVLQVWKEGRFSGMNLGDFINGVRNITGKVPDVLSFTLKLEHMDLDMAVNFNSEEEFQSMKSIFTKYIVQGWKKNENGGSIMEVLIDPIYPQAEVEIHDVEMGDEEWGF